nr:B377 [uncultured bacterium]
MDFERMMLRTTDAMIAQMGPSLKKSIEAETGETVDDELIVRLTSVQAKFLRTHIVDDPKVRRAIGILYARHFTAAELDRLAILYRDPVMRKWTEMAPEMMGDWMPLIFGMMNAHGNDPKAELKQTAEDYFAEKNREEGGAS